MSFQARPCGTQATRERPCLTSYSGMRLNEQQRSDSSPLKFALLDQIRIMNMGANAARALPIGRMPWHNAAARRNNKTIRDLVMPHIQKKLQEDSNDSQVKTIVDLAIKYIDKDDPNASREKPNAAFVDRLVANLKAFLFAGHDTTAATICWMLKLLQDNPECFAKLRAEHDAVLGPDPSQAADALTRSPHLLYALPYTLAVIKETLRLHPLARDVAPSAPGLQLDGAGFIASLSNGRLGHMDVDARSRTAPRLLGETGRVPPRAMDGPRGRPAAPGEQQRVGAILHRPEELHRNGARADRAADRLRAHRSTVRHRGSVGQVG